MDDLKGKNDRFLLLGTIGWFYLIIIFSALHFFFLWYAYDSGQYLLCFDAGVGKKEGVCDIFRFLVNDFLYIGDGGAREVFRSVSVFSYIVLLTPFYMGYFFVELRLHRFSAGSYRGDISIFVRSFLIWVFLVFFLSYIDPVGFGDLEKDHFSDLALYDLGLFSLVYAFVNFLVYVINRLKS